MNLDVSPGGEAAATRFPCSEAQQRCWFIDQLSPGNPALNVALRWELRGRYSLASIERAFQEVIARHEVLRTRFLEGEEGPCQEVLAKAPFKLAQIDLTALALEQRMEGALEIGRSEARVPFNLGAAPLLRATLVRLNTDHAVLLVTAHQIVFDGFSIKVLGKEIGRIAAALDAGAPHRLPELDLQYADYALWQRAWLDSEGYQENLAYWKEALAGARAMALPLDRPRPDQSSNKGEILGLTLSEAEGGALERAARAAGVSVFAYGLAATAALLKGFAETDDLVIGTQIAGREEPELEQLIGVFINNLVLRIDANGVANFSELLSRAAGVVQDAMIHQKLPYNTLVQALNPPRQNGRNPFISVNYTLLHEVIEHGRFGDFVLEAKPSFAAGALYDLNFFIVRWPDGWRLAMEFDPDLFEVATAEALIGAWRRILVEASHTVDTPLDKLSAWRGPRAEGVASEPAARLEAALRRDPDVADAACVPSESGLLAYVAPSETAAGPLEDLPGQLQARMRRLLPDAPPFDVSVVLRLPRLGDGRIDLPALPRRQARSASPAAPSLPAQDRLAEDVRQLWQTLLKSRDISWDDDFFRLGGHSLLALRLTVEVEKLVGVRPPVTALFKAPTLRAYAALVREIAPGPPLASNPPAAARPLPGLEVDEAARIVRFRDSGARTPLIALNNTMLYATLSHGLEPDRPVAAVNWFDIRNPHELPDRSLADIAADYVTLVQQVQPRGPYILMGLCAAGAVAIEAAQQLRAHGAQVPAVVLADCWRPGWREAQPPLRRVMIALDEKRRTLFGRLGRLARRELKFTEFLGAFSLIRRSRLLELAEALGLIVEVPPVEDAENVWFLDHLIRARSHYQVKPFDGDLIVLASAQTPQGFLYDPTMGWEGYANRLQCHRVAGGHVTMFHRPELHALLRACLARYDS